ncbi:hypothetical protein GCM10022219_17990 [Microbacterium oryzae]|uniref:Tripartite tricarboxylate transporter TctB family protein n=1 Tax=Microbacterium oryzae TaxID=743009 RepID=A0A6I6E9Q1_9MICO|nr:tripartite tricarboxylate transporter TctB family protein [Microbacterium oryzae]QGU27908.1 tripartite tricarboxylate transporter TctB family protein [Microbacterium oryzae]
MSSSVDIETGAPPRPSRALEVAFAVLALAGSAVYLALATQIELRRESAGGMDARSWPIVLGVAAVAVAIALLAIAVTRPPATRDDLERVSPGGWLRATLALVVSAAFIALWSVGDVIAFGYRIELFPIVAALYLFVLMLVFGQRRWIGLIVYPLAITAFIYVVFGMLLRIPL